MHTGWFTRDVSVERRAFDPVAVVPAVFGLIVGAVNVIIDYARIRIVVEDRRSAIGRSSRAALRQAPRGRRPLRSTC